MKLLLTFLLLPLLASAQTITPSCSAVITCKPITLAAPTPIPTPTPTPTPPPTGVMWGYFNGQWAWAGDFTGAGTAVNYHHATTSGLHGHTQDIQLTTSGAGVAWPYWLPYFAPNYKLPNPGYTKLLLSIKPTVTGQAFGIHMERVGDLPLPSIELMNYGPASVAGVWASYVVPLKDLGTLGDPTLYKFLIQDHSATSAGWEIDEVGFQ